MCFGIRPEALNPQFMAFGIGFQGISVVQGSSLGSGSQGLDLEGFKFKGLRFELRACRPGRMRVDMHITHACLGTPTDRLTAI